MCQVLVPFGSQVVLMAGWGSCASSWSTAGAAPHVGPHCRAALGVHVGADRSSVAAAADVSLVLEWPSLLRLHLALRAAEAPELEPASLPGPVLGLREKEKSPSACPSLCLSQTEQSEPSQEATARDPPQDILPACSPPDGWSEARPCCWLSVSLQGSSLCVQPRPLLTGSHTPTLLPLSSLPPRASGPQAKSRGLGHDASGQGWIC